MSEKEYIERGALIEELMKPAPADPARLFFALLGRVRRAPAADVVEVVRCKDCKHCQVVDNNIFANPAHFCTRIVGSIPVVPMGYCSYGKRKEQT